MPKIKGTIVGKVKRSPARAGATPRPHGLFPTRAVIKLNAMIKDKSYG